MDGERCLCVCTWVCVCVAGCLVFYQCTGMCVRGGVNARVTELMPLQTRKKNIIIKKNISEAYRIRYQSNQQTKS